MKLTAAQAQLKRKAVVMDIGGFRPAEDPATSWFGRVNLGLPNEEWPEYAGKQMHALCQINLTELPFRPAGLDDLAMIVVFIGPDNLPVDQPNGDNWCLRAYEDISILRPLKPPAQRSAIKALPMKSRLIEADFPCLDDVTEIGARVGDEEQYQERCPNVGGLKLGGWPTLLQSTICWPEKEIEAEANKPRYAFQIDSCQKAHWQWGDGGVGYFGRGGSDESKDEWSLSWQTL